MNIARPMRLLALVVGFALVGPIAGCCGTCRHASPPAPMPQSQMPAKLRVDGPVIARVHATGVQIYAAQAGKDGTLAWTLTAPEATFDGDFKGKHYKGPFWECAADGSKVEGHKLENAPAPAPDAVDWLLLDAKSHSGQGKLSNVTFIQRVNTAGGKAPAAPPLKAGDEARVPYTADYVFFGPDAKRAG